MTLRCSLDDIAQVSAVLDDDAVFVPIAGRRCNRHGELARKFLEQNSVYVVMPNEGSVLIFLPHNLNIFHVHLGFLPGWRGKIAIDATMAAARWIFQNTSCVKIVGFGEKRRRDAVRFMGILPGVKREGLLTAADGQGGDVVIFSLGKSECV